MAEINRIQVYLQTSSREGAETDGSVYVGVAGREFKCAIDDYDDFHRGWGTTYTFGEGTNVENAAANDPRRPQLLEEDAERFPAYVRFDQRANSAWALERALLFLNGAPLPLYASRIIPGPLWLGSIYGAFCYLHRLDDRCPGKFADLVDRDVAGVIRDSV